VGLGYQCFSLEELKAGNVSYKFVWFIIAARVQLSYLKPTYLTFSAIKMSGLLSLLESN